MTSIQEECLDATLRFTIIKLLDDFQYEERLNLDIDAHRHIFKEALVEAIKTAIFNLYGCWLVRRGATPPPLETPNE